MPQGQYLTASTVDAIHCWWLEYAVFCEDQVYRVFSHKADAIG